MDVRCERGGGGVREEAKPSCSLRLCNTGYQEGHKSKYKKLYRAHVVPGGRVRLQHVELLIVEPQLPHTLLHSIAMYKL